MWIFLCFILYQYIYFSKKEVVCYSAIKFYTCFSVIVTFPAVIVSFEAMIVTFSKVIVTFETMIVTFSAVIVSFRHRHIFQDIEKTAQRTHTPSDFHQSSIESLRDLFPQLLHYHL